MEVKTFDDFQQGIQGISIDDEKDIQICNVHGKIPSDINGYLYRNGPGRHHVSGHPNGHWVDGDGLIAMFRIWNEKANFRSRFVRTQKFIKEHTINKRLYVTLGTSVPKKFWRNLIIRNKQIKNPVNINVLEHAGRLIALNEGGTPYALEPETLRTLGEETYSGMLHSAFSAHPKIFPPTGEMYNVGLTYGTLALPAVYIWKVSPQGNITRIAKLRIPHLTTIHDFCITQRYIIITYSPIYAPIKKLLTVMTGKSTLGQSFTWHENQPSIIYLLDRKTGELKKKYEIQAVFQSHVGNAFELGDEVIFDAIFYPDDKAFKTTGEVIRWGNHPIIPTTSSGYLHRIKLSLQGSIHIDRLYDTPVDLPQYNLSHTASSYRYVYGIEKSCDIPMLRLHKFDTISGKLEVFDHGSRCFPGEALFVPATSPKSEDDGWLLTLVYDAAAHRSFLSIIDAASFSYEVARINLPVHVPHGFHGCFVNRGLQ